MNDKTEKAPNYSDEQVAAIVAASPLNLAKAKALGEEMGKSYRSIIAKAKTLENVEYESKPAPQKKPTQETKKEIVDAIFASFDGEKTASFMGLEKATTRALVNLRQAIKSLV